MHIGAIKGGRVLWVNIIPISSNLAHHENRQCFVKYTFVRTIISRFYPRKITVVI